MLINERVKRGGSWLYSKTLWIKNVLRNLKSTKHHSRCITSLINHPRTPRAINRCHQKSVISNFLTAPPRALIHVLIRSSRKLASKIAQASLIQNFSRCFQRRRFSGTQIDIRDLIETYRFSFALALKFFHLWQRDANIIKFNNLIHVAARGREI